MTTRDRKSLRSHEVYKFNDISFNISLLGTKRAIHMNKNSFLLISKELLRRPSTFLTVLRSILQILLTVLLSLWK